MLKKILKNSHFLTSLVKAFRLLPRDVQRFRAWRARPGLIRDYEEKHTVRKLQIGSGPNSLEGWLNTDFNPSKPGHLYLDATQSFPFRDGSFDYIFTEHLIGEFSYSTGISMLRECARVLKPGSKIRISTPNLENILTLGSEDPGEIQTKYVHWASDRYLKGLPEDNAALVLNYFFRGHTLVFVYSPDLLRRALETAGFTEIRFVDPGISEDPNLAGVESHGKVVGDEINRFESMITEATRDRV